MKDETKGGCGCWLFGIKNNCNNLKKESTMQGVKLFCWRSMESRFLFVEERGMPCGEEGGGEDVWG